MTADLAPIFKLARAERLQLVEDLWDSIAQEEAELPVADWKIEELQRRREHYMAHPETGCTWEQVKQYARTGHD